MIRYFIPSDGDDAEHPNVFSLPSNSTIGEKSLRFNDVKKAFPLPGTFHFRFKQAFEDRFVWMDITDEAVEVPCCNGVFTAKVTRLSNESNNVTRPEVGLHTHPSKDFIGAEDSEWSSSENVDNSKATHQLPTGTGKKGGEDLLGIGMGMPIISSPRNIVPGTVSVATSSGGPVADHSILYNSTHNSLTSPPQDDLRNMLHSPNSPSPARVPPAVSSSPPSLSTHKQVKSLNKMGHAAAPTGGQNAQQQQQQDQDQNQTWQQQQWDAFHQRGL